MKNRTAQKGIAIAVVLLGMVAAIAATRPEPMTPCAIAEAWTHANASALPTDYTEFSKYSLLSRRAIYVHLSIDTRKKLWSAHLRTFLSPTSGLTEEQRAIVRTFIARLDAYYDPTTGRATQTREMPTFRLKAVFGAELGHAVFATLGPEEVVAPRAAGSSAAAVKTASLFPVAIAAIRAFAYGFLPFTQQDPNCDCSTESDWCGGSNHCTSGSCVVVHPWPACGTGWNHDCNGLCYKNTSPSR